MSAGAEETLQVHRVGRRPVHLRRITCEGFARDDGLFDIVGTLVDTKPHGLNLIEKSLAPGEPVHDLSLTLIVDGERWIKDVDAAFAAGPHRACSNITDAYRRLIGRQIRPGFIAEAKQMFRRELGCLHMTELLPQMATTAYQMLWKSADDVTDAHDATRTNSPLGGCHALRLDGEIVQVHFPRHYVTPREA